MIDHQGGREEAREEGSVHECMGGMIVHVGSTSVHIHACIHVHCGHTSIGGVMRWTHL